MSATKFSNVLMEWQKHGGKTGKHHQKVSPYEHDWPRKMAMTIKIRENGRIVIARTIALFMPYNDVKSIFNACIIRDDRRTDCLMDRKGYLKVLETLSSVSFSTLQPSTQSPLGRDILFIIEVGEPFNPQRARFQWKNPAPETSHCLEYIWTVFGRVIRERNSDIHINDLMSY